MALEQVISEIDSSAKEEMHTIETAAAKEAAAINAEAKKKKDEFLKTEKAKSVTAARQLEEKELASHKLLLKRRELNARKEVIGQVFAEAQERIEDLPLKERRRLLTSLSKHLPKDYSLYCKKEDLKLVEEISGKKTKQIQVMGGILAISKDGSFRENLTFDVFFEKTKQESMKELSDLLFGD